MADFALELSFDAASEGALVAQWNALREAGLPSQADHARGMTNTPHLSLIVAREIAPDVVSRAARVIAPVLPAALAVRGVLVLGEGSRVTLAHLIEPTAALASLVATLRAGVPALRHPVWTPHVTLARRMPRGAVGGALDVLHAHRVREIRADRLRWWDPDAGKITVLAHSAPASGNS